MGLNFIPHDTNIKFVEKRFWTFALSVFITIGSIFAFYIKDLNYGIDFKGGVVLEVRTAKDANLADLRKNLNALDIGEVSLQEFGSPKDVLIRIPLSDKMDQKQVIDKVTKALGSDVEERRRETVGPKIGRELVSNAILAVVFSLLAILVYIWIRFEWQFAICGVLALAHDCVAVLGLFAVFHYLEFNTNAVVALLITASYSIHDTVVVYDRIRENMKKYRDMELKDLINVSMNETLSRTVLTSATALISLLALFLFGGKVIADFSLPLLIGIAFGTFSSVCLAAPLLLYTGIKLEGKSL